MTAELFNFGVERAKRKSGLKDTALLEDMIAEGFDPCDPIDIQNYYEYQNFQGLIYKDLGPDWSDESLDRLLEDIKNTDNSKTYTVEYDINELISGDDLHFNLDFTTKPPKKT